MSSDPMGGTLPSYEGMQEGQVPHQGATNGPAAVWDVEAQTWVYTDPTTGNQFEWNASAQTYVPRVRFPWSHSCFEDEEGR